MKDIGRNIRDMREDHGWSQRELAAISGINEKYISAIERGGRNAGHKSIARLCDAFATTEDVIRFGAHGLAQFSRDDLMLLTRLKADREKYLCAQDMVQLSADKVFFVRESIRLMGKYPERVRQ